MRTTEDNFALVEPSLVHLWDVLAAPTATVASARAKLKLGWELFQLTVPYGAFGGTASYTHVLVGPEKQLLVVSSRVLSHLEIIDTQPLLALDVRVRVLAVPFEEKDTAHRAGAVWVGPVRKWVCRVGQEDAVRQWLPPTKEYLNLQTFAIHILEA